MSTAQKDRDILRSLAEQVAAIAALPVHAQTIAGWQRINALKRHKPMIWINELPWHELNVNDELTLRTTDPFCRLQEERLRRTLYEWRHLPGDMVVECVYYSPLVIHDSGFGIGVKEDIVKTDDTNDVVAHHYHDQLCTEADLDKIKMPEISYDDAATEENYQRLVGLFGDILPIVKRGVVGTWFAPWDALAQFRGVQPAMEDLALRPAFIHATMERLMSAYLRRWDQYEALGLLSCNANNTRIGSGGLGYVDTLPERDPDGAPVRPSAMWGSATAQCFSIVSPKMHEEFALRYERRFLERFGLNYYGCCEPLHNKVEVLKSIPRLRKISMSPYIDLEQAIKNMGEQFVFSYKPSPAVFVSEVWNPARVRQELTEVLEKTRGCILEVILKDVSTVRYHPEHLWEWTAIAQEVTAQFA